MGKRSFKKSKVAANATKAANSSPSLRKALAKCAKGELIDLLVELAEEDRAVRRRIEAECEVEPPPKELVAATRQAIADATAFDERQINHNFDYDYAAYDQVKRDLSRLIDLGQLRLAMELALELMQQGSYQVEMSDEGLMTDDIEQCLQVVGEALKKCDLPPVTIVAWCEAMIKKDRLGFIFGDQLQALQRQFNASRSRSTAPRR